MKQHLNKVRDNVSNNYSEGDTDMILLNIPGIIDDESTDNPVIQEGVKDIMKDAAKAADIDVDKIKDAWKGNDNKDSSSDRTGYERRKVKDSSGNPVKGPDGKDLKVTDQEYRADIVKDVDDKVNNVLNAIDRAASSEYVDGRSIVARARNSVLQFPVYVTQSLRVNEAHIISKMFERVYTTLVQSVISQDATIDEKEANNLVFLKKYHTNIREAADILTNVYYQPIDEIDKMMQESVFYHQKLNDDLMVAFHVVPTKDTNMVDSLLLSENARLMSDPLEPFVYLREAAKDMDPNQTTDESYTSKQINVTDKDLEELAKNKVKNAADGSPYKNFDLNVDGDLDKAVDQLKKEIRSGKLASNKHGGYQYDAASGRYFRTTHDSTHRTTTSTGRAVDTPAILREADIKKLNGLLPYTIKVSFRMKTAAGSYQEVSYIIGIKTVLHLVYAEDLADELQELVTGNIRSLQKVRYKTGEINFMQYMFNVKGLKADAAKNISSNKRWINNLKRLAEFGKTNGSLLKTPTKLLAGGNVPIPNGTLVLSQSDVSMLISQTGIDLSKVSNAARLAKSLFLISVVIVDSSAGTMRVLFPDESNNWDVQSLASIDAEVSKTDNSQLMKELNKLVNH